MYSAFQWPCLIARKPNNSQPVISFSSSWNDKTSPRRCGAHEAPRTGTTALFLNCSPTGGTSARSSSVGKISITVEKESVVEPAFSAIA